LPLKEKRESKKEKFLQIEERGVLEREKGDGGGAGEANWEGGGKKPSFIKGHWKIEDHQRSNRGKSIYFQLEGRRRPFNTGLIRKEGSGGEKNRRNFSPGMKSNNNNY